MWRKLVERELTGGGQYIQPFSKIPPSMLSRIEDVEDAERELRGCIVLGFCRDGHHIISYTTGPVAAAQGQAGLSLQLWVFAAGQRLRRLWSAPLFRTAAYAAALQLEQGDFEPVLEMSLTVAEAPDSSLLIVHGRSADPREVTSHEPLANYLTLIPGPLHSSASRLRAAHLCYHSLHPHPVWNPFTCMHPLATATPSSSSGSSSNSGFSTLPSLAVALFSVDALRYLHVSVQQQPASSAAVSLAPSDIADPQWQRQQQGTVRSSGWEESLAVRWADVDCWRAANATVVEAATATAERGNPGHQATSRSSSSSSSSLPSCTCPSSRVAQVVLSAPPGAMDVEALAYAALRHSGIPTSALCDYAAVPVMHGSWQGRDGTIVLALLRLQCGREDSQDEARSSATEDAIPGSAERSACLLLHSAAESGEAGVVELLRPPYPWQGDLSSDLVQQLALAGVGFCKAAGYFAEFLRSRHALPLSRTALPLALTNKSVLAEGRSLRYIAHPWLPHAILSYGQDTR